MTKVTDNINNIRFCYLFVEDFKWYSPLDTETHAGNPKQYRLYRGAFNTDTKNYRLFYELDNQIKGLFLPSLHVPYIEDEVTRSVGQHTCHCKIDELTKQILLHIDLSDEDLDSLIKWIEDDNKIIKQFMGLEAQPAQQQTMTGDQVIAVIDQQKKSEEFVNFCNLINRLGGDNKVIFDALFDVALFLDADLGTNDNVDSTFTEFSKTLGAGKNIGKVFEHLSRYGSDNHRINLQAEDLLQSIKYLLFEQGRRNIHNIE